MRTGTLGTCTGSTLWTRATKAAEASGLTGTLCVQTIIHHDDAGNGLTLCNQVIHDLSGVTLLSPAVLVLTHTMLQIEYREFLGGIGEILGGQIYMATTHLLRVGRPVEDLTHRALRHVLHLPEIHVVGRNLNTASPTAGAIVVQTIRIGHVGTVDVQLIVVEALVLRLGCTSPYAVLVFLHLIDLTGDVESYECGLRSRDLCTYHTL